MRRSQLSKSILDNFNAYMSAMGVVTVLAVLYSLIINKDIVTGGFVLFFAMIVAGLLIYQKKK
jgi:hypothetical protein